MAKSTSKGSGSTTAKKGATKGGAKNGAAASNGKGKAGVNNPAKPAKRKAPLTAAKEQKERPVSTQSIEGGYYGAKREDGTGATQRNEGRRLADGAPVDLNTGDELKDSQPEHVAHRDTTGLKGGENLNQVSAGGGKEDDDDTENTSQD